MSNQGNWYTFVLKSEAFPAYYRLDFGSNNMQINPTETGSTKKMAIPTYGELVYVDHILQLGYAETITCPSSAGDAMMLAKNDIRFKLELNYHEEQKVYLANYTSRQARD